MGFFTSRAAAALAVVMAAICGVAAGVDCSRWPSCDPRNRRILFILDGSNSIGQDRFDSDMMNFITNTYCGFSNNDGGNVRYEAGVIVFNKYIEQYIPFQEFSPESFETEVFAKLPKKVKVSCCTPHAEAVMFARELFADPALAPGFENIAFIVTDGTASPNRYVTGGKVSGVRDDARAKKFYEDRNLDLADWTINFPGRNSEVTAAEYGATLLPEQVKLLIEDNIRLFFIGVPSNDGDSIKINLFNGVDKEFCWNNVCRPLSYSPLVSSPPEEHVFSVGSWDIEPLVQETLERICSGWVPPVGRPVCNSVQNSPIPSNANNCARQDLATFADCCGDQGIRLTADDPPSCRSIFTGGAWCVGGVGGRDCETFTNADKLVLEITSQRTESANCCELCQAYGDPQAMSFNGTRGDWVICDAREVGSCQVSESKCNSMVDHNSKTCKWDTSVAAHLDMYRSDIDVVGSPCMPDFTNGRPTMELYSAPGFSSELAMDDRGTIYSVTVTIASGTYTLEAPNCMTFSLTDPAAAFGVASLPAGFFVRESFTEGDTSEIVWQIGDVVTGIVIEAVCIQVTSPFTGKTDKSRLNVRNLVEPDLVRSGGSGFCATGVIAESETSLATPHDMEVLDGCLYNQVARICKAIGNPSCTRGEILQYATQWCSRAFPKVDDIKQCVADMSIGKAKASWNDYYCNYWISLGLPMTYQNCRQRLRRNPEKLVSELGLIVTPPATTCGASYTDYSLRDEVQKCKHGVTISYENSTGAFVDVLFLPHDYMPCNGKLELPAQEFPELFQFPVRFNQCEPDPSCAMEDRCSKMPAISLQLQFSGCF